MQILIRAFRCMKGPRCISDSIWILFLSQPLKNFQIFSDKYLSVKYREFLWENRKSQYLISISGYISDAWGISNLVKETDPSRLCPLLLPTCVFLVSWKSSRVHMQAVQHGKQMGRNLPSMMILELQSCDKVIITVLCMQYSLAGEMFFCSLQTAPKLLTHLQPRCWYL